MCFIIPSFLKAAAFLFCLFETNIELENAFLGMGHDKLMLTRIERFRELLPILPGTEEIPAELLILSAGSEPGKWSYRHVDMPGETTYFIFRKAGFTDAGTPIWECVDQELNDEGMPGQSRLNLNLFFYL